MKIHIISLKQNREKVNLYIVKKYFSLQPLVVSFECLTQLTFHILVS